MPRSFRLPKCLRKLCSSQLIAAILSHAEVCETALSNSFFRDKVMFAFL